MSEILVEYEDKLCVITLNRISKNNAFDDKILMMLQEKLDEAIAHRQTRVIVLKANGKHFSAGADLSWMQRMVHFSEEENVNDAMVLAKLMHTLHFSPKPTIAMIQGAAFGGGAGFAAACDIAIAATDARFCFSEVKLGIIPAVISPYVVKALGERTAKALFISAEIFDAPRALSLNLIQHCVPEVELLDFTMHYAKQIANNAPEAVRASKQLACDVANQSIDQNLMTYTATLIAQKRISTEGQQGLTAFLNKQTPKWSE
jgi:methylglutaconyl-CoA hydratase